MATQPNNNPAGEPPSANDAQPPSIDQEIFDTLGLSSTPADADSIANKEPHSQPGATPPPAGEGGGSTAQPSPEPSPQPSAAPPAAPEPAPAQPSAEPPSAPSAEPATPPAASLAVDEEALRRASLEAQVQALSAEVERLRASPQPGQPAQPGQPQPAAEPGQPAAPQPFRYALTLPEPTRAALLSDDPQQNLAAINAIVNDLGTIVHNTVVGQLRQEFSGAIYSMLQEAAKVEQGSARTTAADGARQDYYKAFPAHNNPLVLPLIQAESQKMAAEFPHLGWNAQYINALGARVNAAMESLSAARSGQPAEPAQPAPGNQPPARPAAMLPSGNREPAAITSDGNLPDDIVGVLSPF